MKDAKKVDYSIGDLEVPRSEKKKNKKKKKKKKKNPF